MDRYEIVLRRSRRSDSPADLDELGSSSHKRPRKGKLAAPCALCALMFSEEGLRSLKSQDGFTHHTHIECIASNAEGCAMCELICELVSWAHDEVWGTDDRLVFRNHSSVTGSPASAIDVLQGSLEGRPDIIKIYPFAKAADPAGALVRRRPLRRNVQSGSVFSAAKRLISSCMGSNGPRNKGHQQCRYSRDTVLPTRVLDLGDPKTPSQNLCLQVNETETHGSYLALSYCWGKPDPKAETQPVRLQKDNIQQLMSDIKLDSLPQSIQDAIVVTRKLGFRYLWVDALCIIQDHGEDKAHEISKMSDIYKNAAITIAASVAEKATQGFLQHQSKRATYLPECMLTIPMPNERTGTIYVSAHQYEPDHPLDKRGWALQEFMLSSRMLIFSDYELLWQCKEVPLQSVTGTQGGLEYLQPLESLPWAVFDDDAEPYFGSLDADKIYLWKTIIHQYTDRDLTDPEDRLRAVMGIVTELEMLWHDQNIHGHWSKWFVQLLAWYKPDVDRVKKRHLKRAPSWSWVSVDGGICYEEPLTVEDAKVKTLTMSKLVLCCRILNSNNVEQDKVDTVQERPDLVDSDAMSESGNNDYNYMLLGQTQKNRGREKGIGLLVLKTARQQYRRAGLVTFQDMSIWQGVELQDVTLE
ncbi:unnamed protein product [Clonostachys rosea]|uniref:Heterokaryon incompatibility domain-containing protein n=1 Tax=Bionectria ochroleuca TaxID=29856 RepID=A0ABY6UDQ6_BIOOC|nr:unnamed protein product [Clonostachys rosea]